jgi:hypothetical protein
MGMTLQCDDKFCPDKLIKFERANLLKRWLMRLTAVLMLPLLAYDTLTTRMQRNPLHDGTRRLAGIKKMAISSVFDFTEIKATSRKLKVTINDMMTASLSVAVKRYF